MCFGHTCRGSVARDEKHLMPGALGIFNFCELPLHVYGYQKMFRYFNHYELLYG